MNKLGLVSVFIAMIGIYSVPSLADPVSPTLDTSPADPGAYDSAPDLQPTKIDSEFYQTPTYISALAFSRASDHVIVGLKDGRIGFFSLEKRIFSPWSESFNPSGIGTIDISPNGNLIAIGTSNQFVQLINAKTFQDIKTFPIGTNDADGVLGVAFSPDGLLLAACAEADPGDFSTPRGEISVWAIKSGVRVCHFYTSTQDPRNVQFSSDSLRLIAGGGNPTVWDVPHNKLVQVLANKGDYPSAISPSGRYVAMTVAGGIYDLKTQTLQPCSLGSLNTISFTADGRYLVGGSSQEGWAVFDGKTGKKTVDLQFPDEFGAISPDGNYIAASSDNLGLDIIKLDISAWTAPASSDTDATPDKPSN